MTDDPKTTNGETEEAAPAPDERSYAERHWPLPALALGVLAVVVALVYWQVFARYSHRARYFEQLRKAAELVETRPYQARPVLVALLADVWRAPETAGRIHALLGRANEAVSDHPDLDPERARHYRIAALAALLEADKLGVADDFKLPLHESLGRMLAHVGEAKQLPLAVSTLSDALRRRDQIAWIVERRAVEGLAAQEPLDLEAIRSAADAWRRVQEVSAERQELAEQVHAAAGEPDVEKIRAILASSRRGPAFEDNPQAAEIDAALDGELSGGPTDDWAARIDAARRTNDAQRSRILEALALAAVAHQPPLHREAAAWASRRIDLPGIEELERDKARLGLAQVLLAADQPREARAILASLTGATSAGRQAMMLLAQSYLEEAERIRATSDVEWIRSLPALQDYSRWIKQFAAGDRPGEAAPDAASQRIAARVAQAIQPAALKQALANAAYHRAAESFQNLLKSPSLPEETAAEARLWLAIASSALGRREAARRHFQEILRLHEGTPIEQAALFHLADLERREGLVEPSLDRLRRAANTVREPRRWDNPYLRPQRLRDVFIENWDDYHNRRRDYLSAVAVAEVYRNFQKLDGVEPGQPDEFYAKSNLELGRLALESAEAQPPDARLALEQEAWAHLREAGRAFARVAKAREASDDYPALLWLAAVNLFEGRRFDEAIPLLHEFLKAHVGGPRDFPARIYLARAYMALVDAPAARAVLEEALRENRSAVDRFRGRIVLAQCYRELARTLAAQDPDAKDVRLFLDAAEQLLLKNISGQNQELDPSAAEWRESLFALGELLFESARYEEAIARFSEHVRRYPGHAEGVDAQNYLAEASWAAASEAEKRLERVASERERTKRQEEFFALLEAARDQFHRLVDRLAAYADEARLSPRHDAFLGNALFKLGRIDAMLGRRLEAIDAFEDLAYRYQDRPECLAAYVEMSVHYRSLGRDEDAQSALRQALWVLDRLDDDAFARSERNREEARRQIQSLLAAP